EAVMKDYQNFQFQQPYQQALYYCSLLLSDQSWPLSDKLDVLPQLEVGHLAKFIPQILSKVFLEGFVAGNIEASEAESIVKYIEDIFFEGHYPTSKPLFPSQHLANRIIKLEKGVNVCYPVEVLNHSDENSALIHYVQVHRDEIKLNVKLQLFALIAKQPAFHQLRSVEQLGYMTMLMQRFVLMSIGFFCKIISEKLHHCRNNLGIWGMQIIVQSSVKDPAYLDARVKAFLEIFENTLREMTVEEYKSNVNALIDMKLEKYKNLKEESSFYWREIADGTLRFDRKESEVAALRDLTHQELIEFFDDHIKVSALKRKTLSVEVYGGRHLEEYKVAKSEPSQPQKVRIDDIFSFRRSRPLYGSFKGVFVQMKL
ncbi:hypothetical protein Taro_048894, partial [Colocasia esculenta]|nr:hypothetical protein [Colocasia esculenta]